MELIWIAIYCVKFCYLAQFKFYKPPYAYVVIALTRYYWTAVGLSWEIAITLIDIVTDVLVMSIPILLIHMANTIRSYTIVNFIFKSLSIFNVVVAATRLALQYDTTVGRIRYVSVTFLLVMEATVALIMVSVSAYRVMLLDFLAGWEREKATQPTDLMVRQGRRHPTATAVNGSRANRDGDAAESAEPSQQQDGSLSDLPMLSTT
ncbi:hypothetical protein SLS60_011646 [Paraconiothyrium brasiliense]|uniref:Integral membrane protein n=1 Tax=Paraconiothyrium brasiliense TaxID=300254 RepID=A0ABR3QI73_9PLEO